MLLFKLKIGYFFTRVILLESRGLTTSLSNCNSNYSLLLNLKRFTKGFWKHFTFADKMKIKPPDSVRGMTQLNKEAFNLVVEVPVFDVNVNHLRKSLKVLNPYLLKLLEFSNVKSTSDSTVKRIILDPDKIYIDGSNPFTETERESLKTFDLDSEKLQWQEITITYDNWKDDMILKSVLPIGVEGSTSYSRIGHIIHLNLRDHLLDYRFFIGQVLLDKFKGISLVVNKVNSIDSTYRTFQMEVVAGEGSTITTVKENGRTFTFDFATVYWNPRLSTEHQRLVECLKPNDILFDVFAGVGPFAIPAAKKKCKVFANDLNPESYKWLGVNVEKNKVIDMVKCFNLDGKDFIEDVFKNEVINLWKDSANGSNNTKIIHVAMNLPALAVEFLQYFNGLFWNYNNNVCEDTILPVKIHVYFFVKCEDAVIENEAKKLVRGKLNLSENVNLEYFYVRCVAPKKHMVKISCLIPFNVLFNKKKCLSSELCTESDAKKICLEINKLN